MPEILDSSESLPTRRAPVAADDDVSAPVACGRWVYWIGGMIAATAVYACWCGLPMIYDGAYQFTYCLIPQKPYSYLTRFHTLILWQPLVWLSRYTENVTALTFAYGLPFLLSPLVGVLGSWWVVRRHAPWLMLWAIFGALAAPLPGQVFVINDSIFQQHLFWPVFLGLIVPGRLTWPQRAFLLVLSVFQLSHQIGVVLFGGLVFCQIVLAILGWRDRPYLRRMVVRLIFAGLVLSLAGLKIYVTGAPHRTLLGRDRLFGYRFNDYYDSYAAEQEGKWEVAKERWRAGVQGLPIRGMTFMYGAAGLAFIAGIVRVTGRDATGRIGRVASRLAIASALVGGAIWVKWASKDYDWAGALEYRRWVVPLTVPFYLLAFLEACAQIVWRKRGTANDALTSQDDAPPSWRDRRIPLSFLVAAVFTAVLMLQSATFAHLTRRLMTQVKQDPRLIVSRGDPDMRWSGNTALSHWATPSYVMVLQGKTPKKMLMDPEADERWFFAEPKRVPMAWFVLNDPRPGPGGWYDCQPLIDAVRAAYEPPAVVPTTPTKMAPDDPEARLKPKAGWR